MNIMQHALDKHIYIIRKKRSEINACIKKEIKKHLGRSRNGENNYIISH
jgi:hypothetical protein